MDNVILRTVKYIYHGRLVCTELFLRFLGFLAIFQGLSENSGRSDLEIGALSRHLSTAPGKKRGAKAKIGEQKWGADPNPGSDLYLSYQGAFRGPSEGYTTTPNTFVPTADSATDAAGTSCNRLKILWRRSICYIFLLISTLALVSLLHSRFLVIELSACKVRGMVQCVQRSKGCGLGLTLVSIAEFGLDVNDARELSRVR